jgi:signal peptidase I
MTTPPAPHAPKSKPWYVLAPLLLVASSPLWGTIALRVFVFELFNIPSPSMTPTLRVGDSVLALKYGAHVAPERGALRVFRFPADPSKDFVNRVVAVAGDRVLVRPDGVVERNGQALPRCALGAWPGAVRDAGALDAFMEKDGDRRYVVLQGRAAASDAAPERCVQEACVVPAGHVLTLGDNRDNSYDGRYWGFVPVDHLRAGPRWVVAASEDADARRFTDPQVEVPVPGALRAAWEACRAQLR